MNDEKLNEFVVTVERKNVEDNVEVDDRVDDRVDRDNTLDNNDSRNLTSLKIDKEDRDNNVEHLHIKNAEY